MIAKHTDISVYNGTSQEITLTDAASERLMRTRGKGHEFMAYLAAQPIFRRR
jgi:hypothetical protein